MDESKQPLVKTSANKGKQLSSKSDSPKRARASSMKVRPKVEELIDKAFAKEVRVAVWLTANCIPQPRVELSLLSQPCEIFPAEKQIFPFREIMIHEPCFFFFFKGVDSFSHSYHHILSGVDLETGPLGVVRCGYLDQRLRLCFLHSIGLWITGGYLLGAFPCVKKRKRVYIRIKLSPLIGRLHQLACLSIIKSSS